MVNFQMREAYHLLPLQLLILCVGVKITWAFEPQPINKDIPEDLGIGGFILNIPQEVGLLAAKPHLKVSAKILRVIANYMFIFLNTCKYLGFMFNCIFFEILTSRSQYLPFLTFNLK